MGASLTQQLSSQKTKLRNLNITIADRADYYRAQEALITDVINKGNDELLMLTHEIAIARKVLRELKTDIRTAAQDKVLLQEDMRMLQVQVTTLVIA